MQQMEHPRAHTGGSGAVYKMSAPPVLASSTRRRSAARRPRDSLLGSILSASSMWLSLIICFTMFFRLWSLFFIFIKNDFVQAFSTT